VSALILGVLPDKEEERKRKGSAQQHRCTFLFTLNNLQNYEGIEGFR